MDLFVIIVWLFGFVLSKVLWIKSQKLQFKSLYNFFIQKAETCEIELSQVKFRNSILMKEKVEANERIKYLESLVVAGMGEKMQKLRNYLYTTLQIKILF